MLEGVTQYELKELIKHLTDEDIVTLADINSQLEYFPNSFAVLVTIKPTVISPRTISSKDHNIKEKGMTLLFLHFLLNFVYINSCSDVVLFPLMIGEKVPVDGRKRLNFYSF